MFVAFSGQSLNTHPDPPYNMPSVVMSGTGVPWGDVSVGASGWNVLLTLIGDLGALVRSPGYDEYVLVMNGGQNNVAGDQTGAQIDASAKAYADAARALGFGTILSTTIPPSTTYNGTQDTNRENANALTLANGDAAFEYVVDLDVPPLEDPSSDYYSLLHYTVLGAGQAAVLVGAVLLPVLDDLT